MALLFGDSFDHYQTDDLPRKWAGAQSLGTHTVIVTDPDLALAPHTSFLHCGNGQYVYQALATPLASIVAGFWFKTASLASTYYVFTTSDAASPTTYHFTLRIDAAGHLIAARSTTALQTSTNTISTNTWYHIEVSTTIDNSAGAYEVRVNGTATGWLSGSSVDTQNGGTAAVAYVGLVGGVASAAGSSHGFQDFYLLSTTGDAPTTFVGPSRFVVLRPVGVGTTAEWTGNYADNWQNVADYHGDSDQTFNQSSTAGQTDQFDMTNVPAGTVHAIQHVLMARQDAGAARTIRPVTRISSTDYNGTSVALTAGSYKFITEPAGLSPATSSAWTASEINGAEFGYEMVS